MAILDFLSGGNAKRAYSRNTGAINDGLAAGTSAINQGVDNSLGLLGVRNGATATSQLGFGYDRGREAMQQGFGQAQGQLTKLGEIYNPLVNSGQAALGLRDDALGANGVEGYGRAKTAFQSSLGYNAGLDEGLDAIQRTAAARGMLASGNTSRDLFNYAADYQNRQAGAYLDRLGAASQNLNSGIAGQATGLAGQAAASQALGTGLSSLDQRYGQNLADLYSSGAQAYLGQGTGIANLNNAATQQRIGNSNMLSDGEGKASSNLFGLAKSIFSAGNLASFLK